MFNRWHGEQAIKLVQTGYMKLGFGEGSGTRAQSFKLDDIEKALDRAEKDSKWGNMVVLEP